MRSCFRQLIFLGMIIHYMLYYNKCVGDFTNSKLAIDKRGINKVHMA